MKAARGQRPDLHDSAGRPSRVMIVDHEGMGVKHTGVAMRMPMRLRALPSLVLVLVVSVVHVQVLTKLLAVLMLYELGIVTSPDQGGYARCCKSSRSHENERGIESDRRPQPTRCGIGDEPAGVRQRELGGKQRRPVLGPGRAAQQKAGRRLNERAPGPQQGP